MVEAMLRMKLYGSPESQIKNVLYCRNASLAKVPTNSWRKFGKRCGKRHRVCSQRQKGNFSPQRMRNVLVTTKMMCERNNAKSQRVITDFFCVRRSERNGMTSVKLKDAREKEIVQKINAGCEEGLEVVAVDGKGRGVVTTRTFEKDDFVVEYAGDLVSIVTAKQREDLYRRDRAVGCYMYYFQHWNKHYCIDATQETGKLGRLLNHSRKGNCYTRIFTIDGKPHLVLLASQHVNNGEELLYDYGDRNLEAVEAYPWLRN